MHIKQSIWALYYLAGMGLIFYLGHVRADHQPSVQGAVAVFLFSWLILTLARRSSLPAAKVQEYIRSI